MENFKFYSILLFSNIFMNNILSQGGQLGIGASDHKNSISVFIKIINEIGIDKRY